MVGDEPSFGTDLVAVIVVAPVAVVLEVVVLEEATVGK
jgi:hypothetical protein